MLKEIKKGVKALEFAFVDGRVLEISSSWLRSRCSCALCLAQSTRAPLKAPTDSQLASYDDVKKMESVGNYGFSITWGDSHRSIYAYDRIFTEWHSISWPEHLSLNRVQNREGQP
jgi:DUF971 family protein